MMTTRPSLEDELVNDYLAESREHLATIEADLLRMEEDGAAIDEQLVNRVFRAAHSIKGGAGFFDFHKIRELAHKAENVLDLVRCRQLVPQPETVSVLLLAFDQLRTMLEDFRCSNEAEIGDFVAALTNLATGHLPDEERRSLEGKVALQTPVAGHLLQIDAFDLVQARRGGRSIYVIEFDLIHDIERRGKTPLEAFKLLMQYGEILETVIDLAAAGTLEDEPANRIFLQVLFGTPLEPDLINEILKLPAGQVKLIEKSGAMKPLSGNAESSPAPVAAPVPLPAEEPKALAVHAAEATIRLNVDLLDSLMTLAGELVLSRNQLTEAVTNQDERGIRASAHRLSLVTSELQSTVAQTRMQPVGSLFAKFPRLVRDLSRDLGKQVQLKVDGGEVEIDKTILEGLSDPLTHMIRNSVDHGIEEPVARAGAGKPVVGTITLRASHQAGQVVIEISDDGQGLSAEKIAASTVAKGMATREQVDAMTDVEKLGLIFLPGVSTADQVSSVSGRGVGMDVVKTNLDRLGGKVEIDSSAGRGTTFRIKLPLTLAIIPSLLVSDGGERFAIPQISVRELIRIPAGQIGERIDRAGDSEVLLLRDRLVPLLYVADVLRCPRRSETARALNVVLVDTGRFQYGLVVDELHDTVEIVVKPLGRHLQELREYAGATILGDGEVAMILDVAGVAERAGLAGGLAPMAAAGEIEPEESGVQSLLLFHQAPDEACAVPIELVTRIERVRPAQVEYLGGRRTMQYGQGSLPLVTLSDVAAAKALDEAQAWVVIVFERAGSPVGLLAAEPLDMVEARFDLDAVTLRQPGVAGSAILQGRTTLLLDIFELTGVVRTTQGEEAREAGDAPGAGPTILVAEDSDFFRGQIRRMIEAVGYRVLAAPDGQAAWELLEQHAGEVSVVATDLEMPRLDGLGLTRLIRADGRFAKLPIIALSSLAGEEEIARALAEGVSEYQVKLDQDQFLEGIRRALGEPLSTR